MTLPMGKTNVNVPHAHLISFRLCKGKRIYYYCLPCGNLPIDYLRKSISSVMKVNRVQQYRIIANKTQLHRYTSIYQLS